MRLKTVHRIYLYKQRKHLLLVINKHKHLTTTVTTTGLENKMLLSTQSADKYIADMCDLALLVGIEDTDLS